MPGPLPEPIARCVEHLQSRKAEDILVLDLRGIAEFTDYFVLCTGQSDTHVRAIADAVRDGFKSAGTQPWHVEGYDIRKWVLLDFVDMVVHVFLPDARTFYGLERLWGDVPTEQIEDVPPVAEMP